MTLSKSPEKLAIMAVGGKKLGEIRDVLLREALPGVTLAYLDEMADKLIAINGGSPSFKTVEGYKWATCLCVNDVVVHGIPTDYQLKKGDLLTVDVGLLYKGFHTDTAWTITVGAARDSLGPSAYEHFRGIGEKALAEAIEVARVGNRIGNISHVIQGVIEGSGYNVVRALVGHGVGKTLHEEPQVPGYLKGSIQDTAKLLPGMTIAIEVIYAEGNGAVVYKGKDGWSIATGDGSLSAVFEHTVAITPNGPLILTQGKK